MSKTETGHAKVPTWIQEQALALGIGPNGIAVYAALYACADWTTGITRGASLSRIARLSGMRSRMTAATTVEALIAARVVEIPGDRKRNRAHVYKIALDGPFSGAQDVSTEDPETDPHADDPESLRANLGAQDLSTRWSRSEHPGAQGLSMIRSTDLSRSLKADPSGLAGAKPDKSGDLDEIGSAVFSPDLSDPPEIGGSAPNGQTGDLPSPSRGPGPRSTGRAKRAQIIWLRDLRAMTGTGLGSPDPLTAEDADQEIRDLWPEIERRRHNSQPLDGNYWDLSQRARAYVDKHDLDIDRREAS